MQNDGNLKKTTYGHKKTQIEDQVKDGTASLHTMLGITLNMYSLLDVCLDIKGTKLDDEEEDVLSQEYELVSLEYKPIVSST